MKSLALLLAALVLSACTAQESAPKSDMAQTQTMLQCAKDTDCKGDRICDNGACVNPAPPSATQASPVKAVAHASAAESSLSASTNSRDTPEYKEAYACAMESFKDGYGGGPAAYCVGNSRDPSDIEGQAYKDAERDFSGK